MIRATTCFANEWIARWSVKRYQRMTDVGIFATGERIELLENLPVLKLAESPSHDSAIQRMVRSLLRAISDGYDLRVQSAIALADSQPEPDHAIVRGTSRDYLKRHPGPDDIALLIEVANTSLLRDQRDKARIYARAAIPVYWIVNLDARVEIHEQPSGPVAAPAYGSVRFAHRGDTLALPVGGSVAVADLLP